MTKGADVSAMSDLGGSNGLDAAWPAGGRRDSVLVVAMVLSPVLLASILFWPAGSLLFGASHLLFTGLVWSAAMVLFGAMLFGLRLSRGSLTPGWLAHLLFNAQLAIHPLISWLAPALRP